MATGSLGRSAVALLISVVQLVAVGFLQSGGALRADVWSHDFHLRDYMQIYDFPEQMVSYTVEFPPRTVRRGGLSLRRMDGDKPRAAVFQLSDAVEQDGFLQRATVSFRTDLPKGASRRFRLECQAEQQAPPQPTPPIRIIEQKNGTAVLAADRLRLRVPIGDHDFPKLVSPQLVRAPLLAVARDEKPSDWCLSGSLDCRSDRKVRRYQGRLIESGPLFAVYRVHYDFDQGQQYTVDLTLQKGDRHVTVDESFAGLQPTDELYLRLNLTLGLDPDRRMVMSNGGYNAQSYCGAFDKHVGPDGRLPYELGLNRPNSLGVMRSTAFYQEDGEHSLLLSLNRLRDWKTVYRQVWYANTGPGNLNFYAPENKKYLLTRLEGGARHWALALIPRSEQVHVRNAPGNWGPNPGGGPEIRLWQRLADFNLNRVKDWVFEWPERDDARMFPEGETISYDQWIQGYGLNAKWWFLNAIVNFYWDFSAEVGPPSYGMMPGYFGSYERSRSKWTAAQRKHVLAILLFLAYTAEDDNNLPHHSMLAGQPNFVMQVKQTVPIACGVFPNHPHAQKWRDSYLKFQREWLDAYGRKASPEHNALGGRWTENIACYSGTSLEALLRCAKGIEVLDDTDVLDEPAVCDWVRWYLNAMMSPHDGMRRVPPEGAHAGAFEIGGGYWNALFEIVRRLERTAPELSRQMRWIETGGTEGTRPKLESVLIRDYGPVLRHDFGGPREAYLHLMQPAGRYNYRWGGGSGVLYYGARNKNFSYNGPEDNGDAFDIARVTDVDDSQAAA